MTAKRNSNCPCGSGKKYKKCCLVNNGSLESDYSHAVQLYNSGRNSDALKICHNILSRSPHHKNTRFLTGTITYNNAVSLQQQGELRNALKAYAKALTLCPNEADIHANMGSAYYDLGELINALKHYRVYLEHVPDDLPVSNRLAKIYEKTLNRDAAIQQYKAILLLEDNPDVHLKMLRLMIERGQFDDSKKKLSSLILRFKNDHEFSFLLADIHRQLGQLEKAQYVYSSLSSKEPESIDVLLRWADFREQVHQLNGAQELIDRILKLDPLNENALLLSARLSRRNRKFNDGMAILESTVPSNSRTDIFSVNYYFELGVTLDKSERYSDAFTAITKANQLAASVTNNTFDIAVQKAGFKHIKKILNKETLQQFSEFQPEDNGITPIFIVGFPRSGTSLLEQIFASHSNICAGDELPFMSALENHFCQTTLNSESPFPDCFTDAKLNINMVNSMREFYLKGASSHGLPYDGKKLFTDKMPLNLLYLGLIHLLFPDSPIIHIRRHPLDVCLSTFFTHFSVGNRYAMRLEDTAEYYSEIMSLTEHYKQHLKLNYLEIRYEDLTTNTEIEVRRLLDFIGLKWDENCLSHHLTKRISKTSSYEQVTNAMYTSSINRHLNYRSELTPIIPTLEHLIKKFGYE